MSRFGFHALLAAALLVLLAACATPLGDARIDSVSPGNARVGSTPQISIAGENFYVIPDHQNGTYRGMTVTVCGAPLLDLDFGAIESKLIPAVPSGNQVVFTMKSLTGTLSADVEPGVSNVVMRLPLGEVVIADNAFECTLPQPVAKISTSPAPAVGVAPLSVTFDASESEAGTGELIHYSWDFGDGASGTGEQVTHEYASAGEFTVYLSVSDEGGTSAVTTTAVTVTDPAPVPAPEAAIQISPVTATMLTGASTQFTASVSGLQDDSVTWTVTGGGTLDDPSASRVIYTAPATAGSVTLTATSVAQPALTASATITVEEPQVTITITPLTAELHPLEQQVFTATVSGPADTTVTWSVSPAPNVPYGMSGNELTFHAPEDSAVTQFEITATSVANPAVSATATAQILPTPIIIDPSQWFMSPGASFTFDSRVDGVPDNDVTWSVTGGSVVSHGSSATYTAPQTYEGVDYQITVTSPKYPQGATANIVVTSQLSYHWEHPSDYGLCPTALTVDESAGRWGLLGSPDQCGVSGIQTVEIDEGGREAYRYDDLETNHLAFTSEGFMSFIATGARLDQKCPLQNGPASLIILRKTQLGAYLFPLCFGLGATGEVSDMIILKNGDTWGYFGATINRTSEFDRVEILLFEIPAVASGDPPVASYNTTYSGTANVALTSLAEDAMGRGLMAGFTEGSLAQQPHAGGRDALVKQVSFMPFIIHNWTRLIGTPGEEVATVVTADYNNDVIVAVNVTPDPLQETQMHLYKLDGDDGAVLWGPVELGLTPELGISGMVTDTSGNIYVAGQAPGSGTETEAFVAKLDPAGNLLWREQFGEAGFNVAATTDMFLWLSDTVVVAGVSEPVAGGNAIAFVMVLNQN